MRKGSWLLAASLVAGTLVMGAGTAQAAAPANDDFAGAAAVGTLPWSTSADTTAATLEAGEPQPGCGWEVGATVWYRIDPAAESRMLGLSTAGSDFDTVLAVWQGTDLGDLTEVGCNDDAIGFQSSLGLPAKAGATYYVQIGGYHGEAGALAFSVSVTELAQNDHRADATPLTAFPFEETVSIAAATLEADEPIPCDGWADDIDRTIWYRHDATERRTLVAATVQHSYIAIWEERADGSLVELSCNHADWYYEAAAVTEAGRSYLVQVGVHAYDSTNEMTVRIDGLLPPANDDLASAQELNGIGDVVEQSTRGATLEAGEPDPGCGYDVGSTVWFRWTPTETDAAVVSTTGSGFDTVLAVYVDEFDLGLVALGEDGEPVRTACNDEAPGFGWRSSAGFVAQAGRTYLIQVGGFMRDSGDLTLRLLRGVSVGETGVRVATDGGDHHEVGAGGWAPLSFAGGEAVVDGDRQTGGAFVLAPFVFAGAFLDRGPDGGEAVACGVVVIGTCVGTGTP